MISRDRVQRAEGGPRFTTSSIRLIQQKPVLRINPTLGKSMKPGAIKIIWAARSPRDEQLPHVCAAPLVRMVCMTQREHFGYCSKSIQLTIGSRNRGDMGLFSLHSSFQAEQTGIIFIIIDHAKPLSHSVKDGQMWSPHSHFLRFRAPCAMAGQLPRPSQLPSVWMIIYGL